MQNEFGYEGPLTLEISRERAAKDCLPSAGRRREGFGKRMLRDSPSRRWTPSHHVLHRGHRHARTRRGGHQGMAATLADRAADPFPDLRDGTGFIQAVMSQGRRSATSDSKPRTSVEGNLESRSGVARADKRAPGGYEIDCSRASTVSARRTTTRSRRRSTARLPARSPASLDSQRAPAGDPARAARDHQRGPRTFFNDADSSWPTRRS